MAESLMTAPPMTRRMLRLSLLLGARHQAVPH